MNCKRAKLHIALLVGDDLEDAAKAELHDHLRECAPCREYHQSMTAVPSPFEDLEERTVLSQHDSLWPGLLDRLPSKPGARVHDFNGWWAALAVGVACFAIALFWNDEAHSGRWSAPVAAQVAPPNPNAILEATKDIPSVFTGDLDQDKPPAPRRRFNEFIFDRTRPPTFLVPGFGPRRGPWIVSPLRGFDASDFGGTGESNLIDESRP
jgi:hypothetical protein